MKTQANQIAWMMARCSPTAILLALAVALAAALAVTPAKAETCQTSGDMDDATRTALNAASQRYYAMITKGDTAALKQSAIPSLASDFSGIEATVKDRQPALADAQATPRPAFLLVADGTANIPRAEFYCGVFNKNGQTRNSAVFILNDLAPGKYAIVILDAAAKTPATVSLVLQQMVLQQMGIDWKLGGLYIKAQQAAGHDGDWFAARAREYKAKAQLHNAWFYYVEASRLLSPVPFMATAATDRLADESQSLQPTDLPADGKIADLATYKLNAIFPEAVENDIDLIVKYQSADVSNTTQAYQTNVAVAKALVTKYPELREAFAAVVARAVDPTGHDYGTLLSLKDIK